MSDEYDVVARGKLKLKTDSNKVSKKKKKDKKEKEKLEREVNSSDFDRDRISNASSGPKRALTKAELSFKKMQDKMQEKRIMEKATLTHKQRVEKFNEHLDNLTEHFDIPKVSWTK